MQARRATVGETRSLNVNDVVTGLTISALGRSPVAREFTCRTVESNAPYDGGPVCVSYRTWLGTIVVARHVTCLEK